MQCPKCGTKRLFDFDECPTCGRKMFDSTPEANVPLSPDSSSPPTASNYQPTFSHTSGAIQALKFFAWLDLVAGISGSIFIWVNFARTPVAGYYSMTETNPVGLGLGFAVLFQGIFCCVLFLVIAQMAQNLIAIKTNTIHKSAAA